MRGTRRRRTSAWQRLAQPLVTASTAVLSRLYIWLGLLLIVYACSGITVVNADEAALVLRLGHLARAPGGGVVHPPGLLLALPKPFDEVVRVNVRRIEQIEVANLSDPRSYGNPRASLDPSSVGYAITGNHNIVHARFNARYQVVDPAAVVFGMGSAQALLGDVVTSEADRAIGERDVDAVLTDQRTELVELVKTRTQRRLDDARAGIKLVALELVGLAPPGAVGAEFTAVQSAAIKARTAVEEANATKAEAVPRAQAAAAKKLSEAKSYAVTTVAAAEAAATAFQALVAEEKKNPQVVRERLYRDAMANVLASAGKRELIPPPNGKQYHDLRLDIQTGEPP